MSSKYSKEVVDTDHMDHKVLQNHKYTEAYQSKQETRGKGNATDLPSISKTRDQPKSSPASSHNLSKQKASQDELTPESST